MLPNRKTMPFLTVFKSLFYIGSLTLKYFRNSALNSKSNVGRDPQNRQIALRLSLQ